MALVPDFMIRAAARFGPARGLLQRRWRRFSLREVVRRFDSPAWIEAYMEACFTYRHDRHVHGLEDHWQTPRSTFERRTGDCEDYALFADYVLRVHGFESNVFAAFTEDDGHAVCLVRERGVYYTLANDGLQRVGRGSSVRGDAARKLVAWMTADRIYPGRWTSCAWVVEFERNGDGGDPEEVLPVFEWVEPRGSSLRNRRPGPG